MSRGTLSIGIGFRSTANEAWNQQPRGTSATEGAAVKIIPSNDEPTPRGTERAAATSYGGEDTPRGTERAAAMLNTSHGEESPRGTERAAAMVDCIAGEKERPTGRARLQWVIGDLQIQLQTARDRNEELNKKLSSLIFECEQARREAEKWRDKAAYIQLLPARNFPLPWEV